MSKCVFPKLKECLSYCEYLTFNNKFPVFIFVAIPISFAFYAEFRDLLDH